MNPSDRLLWVGLLRSPGHPKASLILEENIHYYSANQGLYKGDSSKCYNWLGNPSDTNKINGNLRRMKSKKNNVLPLLWSVWESWHYNDISCVLNCTNKLLIHQIVQGTLYGGKRINEVVSFTSPPPAGKNLKYWSDRCYVILIIL